MVYLIISLFEYIQLIHCAIWRWFVDFLGEEWSQWN